MAMFFHVELKIRLFLGRPYVHSLSPFSSPTFLSFLCLRRCILPVPVIFITILQIRWRHQPHHYHHHHRHRRLPWIPMTTLHSPAEFQSTTQINTILQFQPLHHPHPLHPLLTLTHLRFLGPLVFATVSAIVAIVSVFFLHMFTLFFLP